MIKCSFCKASCTGNLRAIERNHQREFQVCRQCFQKYYGIENESKF